MLRKVMRILKAAENRETFFRRVIKFYPASDWRYKLIEKAYNDAKDAFRKKKRDSGERYFEHLRAVTLIVMDYLMISDYIIICAALLHDIIEDCPEWTYERVRKEYGEDIAHWVDWMTKPYYKKLQNAPRIFFIIKLADRLHNMITIWSCAPKKIQRKIIETEQLYLSYAAKEIVLYHEILEAVNIAKKKLKENLLKTRRKNGRRNKKI